MFGIGGNLVGDLLVTRYYMFQKLFFDREYKDFFMLSLFRRNVETLFKKNIYYSGLWK